MSESFRALMHEDRGTSSHGVGIPRARSPGLVPARGSSPVASAAQLERAVLPRDWRNLEPQSSSVDDLRTQNLLPQAPPHLGVVSRGASIDFAFGLPSLPLKPPRHAGAAAHARPQDLGLGSGFEPPDLDRPGRQLHQQGLSEARLGCRGGSPPKRAPGPELDDTASSTRSCRATGRSIERNGAQADDEWDC